MRMLPNFIQDMFGSSPPKQVVIEPTVHPGLNMEEAMQMAKIIETRCLTCTEVRTKFAEEFGKSSSALLVPKVYKPQECIFSLRIDKSNPTLLQQTLQEKFQDNVTITATVGQELDTHDDGYPGHNTQFFIGYNKIDCEIK